MQLIELHGFLCDLFMDVLTGGGLGDLFRKIILGERQQIIDDNLQSCFKNI